MYKDMKYGIKQSGTKQLVWQTLFVDRKLVYCICRKSHGILFGVPLLFAVSICVSATAVSGMEINSNTKQAHRASGIIFC